MRHRALAVLSGFLLAAAAATAQAPPGYKTWENKLQRVTFHYPVVFQELPLPPTEQVLVAKYVLKDQPEELKKIDVRVWRQLREFLWRQVRWSLQWSTGERRAGWPWRRARLSGWQFEPRMYWRA